MPKRYVRKTSSKRVKRTAESDSLKVMERRVIEIAEQLGRVAASAQKDADRVFGKSASLPQLNAIRKRVARLIADLSVKAVKSDVARRQVLEQSREKVAAPGKKHRKAPDVLRGVKHSDERISKALTTQRRRSSRPREG